MTSGDELAVTLGEVNRNVLALTERFDELDNKYVTRAEFDALVAMVNSFRSLTKWVGGIVATGGFAIAASLIQSGHH